MIVSLSLSVSYLDYVVTKTWNVPHLKQLKLIVSVRVLSEYFTDNKLEILLTPF